MAHWLSRLLGATAAVLLLVLWAAFAWTPSEGDWWQNPYSRLRSQMLSRQHDDHVLLVRKVRVDSLQPLLGPAPGVVVRLLPNLREDVAAALRTTVAAELAGVAPVRARIGIFTIPASLGESAAPGQARPTAAVEYYASNTAPHPSCLVVGEDRPDVVADSTTPFDARIRLSDESEPAGMVREDVLGPCLFWAKYGAPGTGIFEWLRGPGRRFASSNAEVKPVPRDRREAALRYARYELGPYGARQFPACQAGYLAECRMLLVGNDPQLASGTPVRRREPAGILLADARQNWHADENDYTYGALLSAVEREFGSERFARFWQSDRDVEQAFAAAFGVELTPWAMNWLQYMYGEVPRGPRLALHHLLLVLLALGALLGMAVRLGVVRQTGR